MIFGKPLAQARCHVPKFSCVDYLMKEPVVAAAECTVGLAAAICYRLRTRP